MPKNLLKNVSRGLGWLLISLVSSIAGQAVAAKNETRINFDFVSRQVVFYGLFFPQAEGKTDGLSAELFARRDGIAHLTAKLQESCSDASTAQGTTRPSSNAEWISSVRSQGSEIYTNGVLKISLTAPVREVFKEFPASSFALKSKSGTPLALRFPVIPLDQIRCGKLSLTVGTKKVDVNPFALSKDASAQVVRLSFEGNSLVPSKPEDLKTLEESNLFGSASDMGEPVKTKSPAAATSSSQE